MNSIVEGVSLMIIGMTTVFAILGILIGMSEVLIRVVNKYAPEETVIEKKSVARITQIDDLTMEIIRQTVRQLTGGKGQIAKVEKL